MTVFGGPSTAGTMPAAASGGRKCARGKDPSLARLASRVPLTVDRSRRITRPNKEVKTTMARLPYVEPDTAPAEVKAAYEKARAATGRISNFMKLLAHFPPGMQAAMALMGAAREGKLDPKLRELAYLKVSKINGCHY